MFRKYIAACLIIGLSAVALGRSGIAADAASRTSSRRDRVASAPPTPPTAAAPAATTAARPEPVLKAPASSAAPTSPPASDPVLSPAVLQLREKVRRALEIYGQRHLNSRDHSPWEVMHGFIGYGVKAEIRRGGPSGDLVNAIGWICFDGRCRGDALLTLNRGQPMARIGPGLQGHPCQFLAMLAQSRVKPDYPMQIAGMSFTVADLIEQEKLDCRAGTELTFKLIALSHYLDSDETWASRDGQAWSVSRLIQEEIKQPVRGAACGGTHRLFGLSYAVRMREKQGKPIDGQFRRAQTFISDYHHYTFGSLQNQDGSFSTEWFTRPGARKDLDRRLQTSGHILEWLAFSLPRANLNDPLMMKSVDYIASILLAEPKRDWSIGPLGHAIHALVMYDERISLDPRQAAQPALAQRAAPPAEKKDVSTSGVTKPAGKADAEATPSSGSHSAGEAVPEAKIKPATESASGGEKP